MRTAGVRAPILAILAALFACDGGAASARVVTITVSGTVNNFATGSLALFGVAPATLFGSPMTEVYSFDLAKGSIGNSGSNFNISGSGAASPSSALLTLG